MYVQDLDSVPESITQCGILIQLEACIGRWLRVAIAL
jgi:hypothetical protein